MLLSDVAPSLNIERPYPGLRPFESNEAFLFHGRDDHTHALVDRLASERFLAVVGTSGSGKSSLVRAGLLPALYRGYLGASSQWRIAVMRPGNAPMLELTRALASPRALGLDSTMLAETVSRTSLGLTTAVRRAGLAAGANFLLVVDQFEELFRFERERRSRDGGAEATLFVQSLIEAADAYDSRIYVVLTIRSDFLGQCAQFAGLPEALNRGQYLIPHLTRQQRREAIELPPMLAGVRIQAALVQQLLNDLGDDPAQLPVLQHALMRTFSARKTGETELNFNHYEAAGGIASALDIHADSIMLRLEAGPRAKVERLFRCLTTVEGGRAVRRPARLDRIHAVLGVTDDSAARADVDRAILAFADPANSLLVSSTGPELTAETVIDISHETLIKNWRNLNAWLADETRSAEWLRSLAGDCVRFRTGEAGPWRDPELGRVLQLKDRDGWNDAWAAQYLQQSGPPFVEISRFLDLSLRQQREDQARLEAARRKELEDARALAHARRRATALLGLLSFALAIALAFGVWTVSLAHKTHEAEQAKAEGDVKLSQRATEQAQQAEALKEQLRRTEEQLGAATQNGAKAELLKQQASDLQKRVDALMIAEKNSRQTLQGNAAASGNSEYAASLKQIADLQGQLKKVRDDRDHLQDQVDTYATVQGKDSAYWRTRFDAAETERKQLQSSLAAALVTPSIFPLPQHSALRLRANPFRGRVILAVGDLGRLKSSLATLYVIIPEGKDSYAEFADDEKQADRLLGTLRSKLPCPGYQTDGQATVWCFTVNKERTLSETQPLGQFRFSSSTFAIVATGWAQNARNGSDVMSLVVFPAPATPASSK